MDIYYRVLDIGSLVVGIALDIAHTHTHVLDKELLISLCLAVCYRPIVFHCFRIIVCHIRLILRFHCLHFDWRNFNELHRAKNFEIKISMEICTRNPFSFGLKLNKVICKEETNKICKWTGAVESTRCTDTGNLSLDFR